ncbi:Endonuclease/exonuclease/phosphatase [Peziza echinospora]|nr:Endonuclease/exonuclease/phosphatase [Peziza echinospora]
MSPVSFSADTKVPEEGPSPPRNVFDKVRQTGGPYSFEWSSWTWTKPLSLPTKTWNPVSSRPTTPIPPDPKTTENAPVVPAPLKKGDIISILTWNIDFSAPFARQRVEKAIEHIREVLASPSHSSSTGTVLLFQEVYGQSKAIEESSLQGLFGNEWIQKNFLAADVTFSGSYGSLTFVSKNIAVVGCPDVSPKPQQAPVSTRGCFRLPFPHSNMGRDVLGMDLLLESGQVLRVCNVHLESLSGVGTRQRPKQLAIVSKFLQEPGVACGFVAGDMNAIEESDFTLPQKPDIQLRDLWENYNGFITEPSGQKQKSARNESPTRGEKKGHTWGYQGRPTIFWPRRLDKILFRTNTGASIGLEPVPDENVDRLGVGLKVRLQLDITEEDEEQEYTEEDYMEWVSDHFGLAARLMIGDSKYSEEV